MMSLASAPPKKVLIVQGITGGHEMKHRLSEMGLFIGSRIELVQARGAGPVMVRVGGSRVALGRGMAKKIEVSLG